MESKPLWQSKTFWWNVLGTATTFSGVFGPQAQKYIVGAITLGNVILRLISNQSVTITGSGGNGN